MENMNNDNSQQTVNLTAPKKSKAPVIVGSALGTVAVAGAATACVLHFVPSARDWLDRKTSEPEEYFAEKEKDYVKENVEALSDSISKVSSSYEAFDLSNLDFDNLVLPAGAYNFKTSVDFSVESLLDIAEDMGENPIDTSDATTAMSLELLKSFKSVSVDSDIISNGEGLLSFNAKLQLNDSSLIDANVIINTKDKVFYIGIPVLSDKYLSYTLTDSDIEAIKKSLSGADVSSEDYDKMMEQLEMATEASKLLSDNLSNIVTDYYQIIIDGIKNDTDLSEDASIEVAGKEFSVTEMTTDITEEDFTGICKDILEKAKDDKNITSIVDSMGISSEYADAIDEALDSLKESNSDSESDETVQFYAWTDKKGNIIGHKLSIDDTEFGYANIENNDNQYTSMWMSSEDEKMSYDIVLNGENKDNGTITFTIDIDEVYMVMNYDIKELKVVDKEKGLVDFDIDVTFDLDEKEVSNDKKEDTSSKDSEDESNSLGDESVSLSELNAAKLFESFTFNAKSKCEDSSQTLSYVIKYKDNDLFSLSLAATSLDDTTVKAPDDSDVITLDMDTAQDALISYLESISLSKMKDNIKNSVDNAMLSTLIDQAYTTLDLNKIDGSQSVEDVMNLINLFAKTSTENKVYEDEDDYLYEDSYTKVYEDKDDYESEDEDDYDYESEDENDKNEIEELETVTDFEDGLDVMNN